MPRWPRMGAPLLFIALLGLSRLAYDVELGGVPDDGRMPVSLLPSFLFEYQSGSTRFSNTPAFWLPWALASLAYLVPAMVLSRSGGRSGALKGLGLSLASIAASWLLLPPLPSSGTDFVPSLTAATTWSGVRWQLALGLLGVGLGLAFARFRAKPRGE